MRSVGRARALVVVKCPECHEECEVDYNLICPVWIPVECSVCGMMFDAKIDTDNKVIVKKQDDFDD